MRPRIYINTTAGAVSDVRDVAAPSINNVSDVARVTSTGSKGYKGFLLSTKTSQKDSLLDGRSRLFAEEGYPGIVTSALSGKDAVLTFTVPMHVKKVFVVYDVVLGEYAKSVYVRLNTATMDDIVTGDSPVMILDLPKLRGYTKSGDNTVQMSRFLWSKSGASVKITKIMTQYSDVLSANDIIEIRCSENSINESVLTQPGVIEQYAEIRLYDRYKLLDAMVQAGMLKERLPVSICAVDAAGQEKTLGRYTSEDWDVSATSREVKVVCSDPSTYFEDIDVETVPIQTRTTHEMLTLLFSYMKNYTWKYASSKVQKYCELIEVPNSWIKKGKLSEVLNKLCIFAMLCIYWSKDAFVVARID